MEWWQSLLIAFGVSAIPITLTFILNYKGANKKLDIEEDTLQVNQFDAQIRAFQALVDAANKNTEAANHQTDMANRVTEGYSKELEAYKSEREELLTQVSDQGKEIERTNSKLNQLRGLFTSYISRTGIPLTAEEQQIFEVTIPSEKLRQMKRRTT